MRTRWHDEHEDTMKVWRVRILLLILVSGIACSPTRGCIEASFALSPESAVPVWFTPPAGMTRQDVTITMDSWSGPGSRTKTFTLLDKTGNRLDRVVGDAAGNEPIKLSISEYPSYPSFEFVTVRGISEVVEYREMGPVVLINRDPKVRAQVEKIAKERR
jgi:hypothetical protein